MKRLLYRIRPQLFYRMRPCQQWFKHSSKKIPSKNKNQKKVKKFWYKKVLPILFTAFCLLPVSGYCSATEQHPVLVQIEVYRVDGNQRQKVGSTELMVPLGREGSMYLANLVQNRNLGNYIEVVPALQANAMQLAVDIDASTSNSTPNGQIIVYTGTKKAVLIYRNSDVMQEIQVPMCQENTGKVTDISMVYEIRPVECGL
jgi:hypothetical protein